MGMATEVYYHRLNYQNIGGKDCISKMETGEKIEHQREIYNIGGLESTSHYIGEFQSKNQQDVHIIGRTNTYIEDGEIPPINMYIGDVENETCSLRKRDQSSKYIGENERLTKQEQMKDRPRLGDVTLRERNKRIGITGENHEGELGLNILLERKGLWEKQLDRTMSEGKPKWIENEENDQMGEPENLPKNKREMLKRSDMEIIRRRPEMRNVLDFQSYAMKGNAEGLEECKLPNGQGKDKPIKIKTGRKKHCRAKKINFIIVKEK